MYECLYQEQNDKKENRKSYVTVWYGKKIVLGCTTVTGLKYIVVVCIRTNCSVLMIDSSVR